ncbi:MAG TPA: hypothetical protein VKA50_04570 [Gammaproteobacteria bacterium]|nr:hypothetical protein [Gammaproteobacteria bacterium]
MRRVNPLLFLVAASVAFTVLAGCAGLPAPPSESMRQEWGPQVLAPARYAPHTNFRGFAAGRKEGAGKGAAAGSVLGLAEAGMVAASSPLGAVIAPYVAAVSVPVLATSGAVAGAKAAMSEQDAAALDREIRKHLADLKMSEALSKAIAETARRSAGRSLPLVGIGPTAPGAAPDYAPLGREGTQSVVEVDVSRVGFNGGKQLRFYLVADIRIVRIRDGAGLYERKFVYQSDQYPAALWAKDEAALFQAELQRGYASLADSVVNHIYLFTPLPPESRAKPTAKAGAADLTGRREACGLAWSSPARDYHPSIRDIQHRTWNRFTKVSSREPNLTWEAFPRDIDRRTASASILNAIDSVRYDLRLWRVSTDMPPRLIVERDDLTVPSYTLDKPLSSGGRYFWSARARFDLGGQPRATQWGYFRTPYYLVSGADEVKPKSSPATVVGAMTVGAAPRDPCTLDFIPTANYYRFEVP